MSAITQWTQEQTQLISSTIAPGCTSDELKLFAYACQRTGLDPFSRQVYAIKRSGKMSIQVGIDGLRAVAERTGQLDGSSTEWCGDDGIWADVWLGSKPPAAAKTTIWRKGSTHPFVGTALFRDYNANQGMWGKMPAAMIAKCSEALALRKAFPACAGLYTVDEMEQETVTVTAKPAPALAPAVFAGDAKVFAAGKAAIAKADSIAKLTDVTGRMEARKGDLSDDQYQELLKLALAKETELMPPAADNDADPFADD